VLGVETPEVLIVAVIGDRASRGVFESGGLFSFSPMPLILAQKGDR
jgi:hypothetical protein